MILLEDFQGWIFLELPRSPPSLLRCLIGKGSRIIFLILTLAGLRGRPTEPLYVFIPTWVLHLPPRMTARVEPNLTRTQQPSPQFCKQQKSGEGSPASGRVPHPPPPLCPAQGVCGGDQKLDVLRHGHCHVPGHSVNLRPVPPACQVQCGVRCRRRPPSLTSQRVKSRGRQASVRRHSRKVRWEH